MNSTAPQKNPHCHLCRRFARRLIRCAFRLRQKAMKSVTPTNSAAKNRATAAGTCAACWATFAISFLSVISHSARAALIPPESKPPLLAMRLLRLQRSQEYGSVRRFGSLSLPCPPSLAVSTLRSLNIKPYEVRLTASLSMRSEQQWSPE